VHLEPDLRWPREVIASSQIDLRSSPDCIVNGTVALLGLYVTLRVSHRGIVTRIDPSVGLGRSWYEMVGKLYG
jgi:hypothetical protein